MIFVVDFGSQTTHLIARRIKDLGFDAEIVAPENILNEIKLKKPQGIILSGGPSSVYEKNSPSLDKRIYEKEVPILGICFGMQLTVKLIGGKVIEGEKEYGPAELKISNFKSQMSNKLPQQFVVWMSHADEVIKLPKGFEVLGSTKDVKNAFVGDKKKRIFGIQFHPEVEHTENGNTILSNFINLCNAKKIKSLADVQSLVNSIRNEVGKSFVIGAVSGGVDSTVAGLLTAKAIGRNFIPIYVDNGLMRDGAIEHVCKIFKIAGVSPIIINAKNEMIKRLKGVIDPEEKRKIIGHFYIEIFEREMEKLKRKGINAKYLLQGTIYSDVIESKGTKHSSKIKSHHNVGGLPKKMKFKLLEPLREFYKDEVKALGESLGLSSEFVLKQPFPGPGYAIRIRGEVTKERLEEERLADNIVMSELKNAGILQKIFISFPVLTNSFSTAVKGDGRFFGEVIAVRIVESKDVMTSKWAEIPYGLMQKISSRIVSEVPGISRVVYDITTKPPATMEWE